MCVTSVLDAVELTYAADLLEACTVLKRADREARNETQAPRLSNESAQRADTYAANLTYQATRMQAKSVWKKGRSPMLYILTTHQHPRHLQDCRGCSDLGKLCLQPLDLYAWPTALSWLIPEKWHTSSRCVIFQLEAHLGFALSAMRVQCVVKTSRRPHTVQAGFHTHQTHPSIAFDDAILPQHDVQGPPSPRRP